MKKGYFESDNPVENLVYSALNDSLPVFLKKPCPFKPGVYEGKNVTVSTTSVPLSYMAPSGMYKVFVNVSSGGKIWGHGWGTGEVKTPLRE